MTHLPLGHMTYIQHTTKSIARLASTALTSIFWHLLPTLTIIQRCKLHLTEKFVVNLRTRQQTKEELPLMMMIMIMIYLYIWNLEAPR